jgi:hypothetical protein
MTKSWRSVGFGVLVGLLAIGPARAADNFNLKVTVSDVQLGAPIMGPKLSATDLQGKVVLLELWGIR